MNNDLISRNVLIQHAYSAIVDGVEKDIIDLSDVDNAPTVPLPDFKEGYKQAIIDGKTNFSRPQGEWGKWVIAEIRCPNCLEYFQTDCYSTEELNKCPVCGANMKGGAE